ncbi:MAG: hypothetical protein ACOVN0_05835 [Niveispirillum sp.]|uniref:hypothetical protein n=1 Tax=Niveispirillum sp. TaxID=1917217 RepID=UPI003BA5E383
MAAHIFNISCPTKRLVTDVSLPGGTNGGRLADAAQELPLELEVLIIFGNVGKILLK